ncbi:pyridoxamine 5'-phosphate oxidase family protein [Hyphococcus luteus]|uniref:Pyridoxamine 5-phosphate oxidase n=1 Tax=Hyphococcus luteus TaxID=2058213 RepID=A0A2S7K5T2_9PROT|nr:pyridoxamine 5'-phosphate oxidase family protein [Marinicaulis flavus]PQA87863.1 pyridoxamine 5-phosphate oxidase [Marinicaulis flavus]
MARAFSKIAFTDTVRALQAKHGSAGAYAKFLAPEAPPNDSLGEAEAAFIRARDGFYQATVSETGWPYVQFRGGPPGFMHVLDEKTLAYADFRGNRQYLSVGNLLGNGRIALFFMDYPNKRRLKLLGQASIVEMEDHADLVNSLHTPGYEAKPERAMIISVAGYDWNCPQHIPQRYTLEEMASTLSPIREELAALRRENADLKEKLEAKGG